mmetsp:Transcript_126776/g.178853  ORF Transcript_126776/g.178853 Transcript_126776/m.178853 type:complete len:304 (-) Transcript_126776:264-1175(-)
MGQCPNKPVGEHLRRRGCPFRGFRLAPLGPAVPLPPRLLLLVRAVALPRELALAAFAGLALALAAFALATGETAACLVCVIGWILTCLAAIMVHVGVFRLPLAPSAPALPRALQRVLLRVLMAVPMPFPSKLALALAFALAAFALAARSFLAVDGFVAVGRQWRRRVACPPHGLRHAVILAAFEGFLHVRSLAGLRGHCHGIGHCYGGLAVAGLWWHAVILVRLWGINDVPVWHLLRILAMLGHLHDIGRRVACRERLTALKRDVHGCTACLGLRKAHELQAEHHLAGGVGHVHAAGCLSQEI